MTSCINSRKFLIVAVYIFSIFKNLSYYKLNHYKNHPTTDYMPFVLD